MAVNTRGETVPTRAIKRRRWARPDWIEEMGGEYQHQKKTAAERRALRVKRERPADAPAHNAAPANIGQPDMREQRERIRQLLKK